MMLWTNDDDDDVEDVDDDELALDADWGIRRLTSSTVSPTAFLYTQNITTVFISFQIVGKKT